MNNKQSAKKQATCCKPGCKQHALKGHRKGFCSGHVKLAQDRKRAAQDRKRRATPRSPATFQSRDAETFFAWRYGGEAWIFPDDDEGADNLWIAVQLRAARNELPDATLKFIKERAPWKANPDTLLTRVYDFPYKFKADTLANKLGITRAIRNDLDLTAIGATDFSKKDRKLRRKNLKNAARTANRRAEGMKPREQWLAESLSRTKPWDAEGIHRRTWERRRKLADAASVRTASILKGGSTPAARSKRHVPSMVEPSNVVPFPMPKHRDFLSRMFDMAAKRQRTLGNVSGFEDAGQQSAA